MSEFESDLEAHYRGTIPYWDVDQFSRSVVSRIGGRTQTSPVRVLALIDAIRHVSHMRLEGDIVECGVWRGGSMMAAAWTLLELGDVGRSLWLYDTFEGMPDPTDADFRLSDGSSAISIMRDSDRDSHERAYAALDDVHVGMSSTGYPSDQLHYIVGKVEETLLECAPNQIALLRLDTDFYTSTLCELEVLYDRIVPGGVLIVDDYGWWSGARRAVDEFFHARVERPFLSRIDEGRIGVKLI